MPARLHVRMLRVQRTTDSHLDTRRAVSIVETIISQFLERRYLITEYYEHWKVHVSTGREFHTQWQKFIQDARKVGARTPPLR